MLTKRIFPTLWNTFRKMSTENHIIFKEVGDKGIVIFNRPEILNALNLSMVNKMNLALAQWEKEKKTLVIIKGAGGRAFSAGGNLKEVAAVLGDKSTYKFFREVYQSHGFISSYKVPHITLIDGIIIGGAIGLAVLGPYSVATERTLWSMPESQIGLYPDSGASYYLSRLNGRLGWYLGMTGATLKGIDVFRAGLSTHYTESSSLPALEEALLQCSNGNDIKNTLSKYHKDDKTESSLAPYMEKINHCFSAPTVEEIYARLEKDGSKWAENTIKALKKMSPTSLKITYKGFELGKNMKLLECLQMETRMTVHCLDNHDFKEGVRARLVDKDQNPKWQPATIEEVTDKFVNSYFEKVPEELEFKAKL